MPDQLPQDEQLSASYSASTTGGTPDTDPKEVEKYLRGRLESAKRNRKQFENEWKRNVELRQGKVASQYTGGISVEDGVQTEINPDWALTKTKTANLYSQVPTVQGTHENKQYAAAIPPFMKALNYELSEKRTNIGVAMEECLNDVVNASGIAAMIVGYAARFEMVEMPVEDTIQGPQGPIPTKGLTPDQLKKLAGAGLVHMKSTQRVVSDKLFTTRISPINLLWPAEFMGSNVDDADFIGYEGLMSWSEALNEFGKTPEIPEGLVEADKENVLHSTVTSRNEDLRSQPDKGGIRDASIVRFSKLYYWDYRVDPEQKHFQCIKEIVFIDGKEGAVRHEQWKGQRYDEQTKKYIGSVRFPIRVLTLTYITDNFVPPSDSAAGRPQVNDMRRSRSQMFQQRERSIPIRWVNTNLVDPTIYDSLLKGTWQAFIPVNGTGERAMGEVARASYPSEDMSFDVQNQQDLERTWGLGANQQGMASPGKKTGAEVNITQQNFATRIGQERARVASFFLSACEVLAGWMVLYSEFPTLTDQERQAMQQVWDQKHILHDLVLKIRPDSQVVLDTAQRLDRIFKFINMTAKSGYVNVKPLLVEAAELSGIDPSEVIIDPQPPKPEEPNVSLRLSGKDDLMNLNVMALLASLGKMPKSQHVEEARKYLHDVQDTEKPPAPQGAEGQGAAPGAGHPPSPPGAPPGQDAHPQWQMASKIAKRSREIGGN